MFGGGHSADNSEGGLTRRTFLSGVVVVGAAVGLSGAAEDVFAADPALAAPAPPSGPPTTTIPLPTTTAPEQLWLTWGRNPATDVTVSWLSPGEVPAPAPSLSWSARPITAGHPGRTIELPEPQPLDVTQRYPKASSVAFTDGLNAQTTYYYHVELRDLEPDTTYYYQVSDGAFPAPSTAGASFTTAPAGRAKFRFSSYGDLATPSYDLNASGNQWHESCDNSYYAVNAIENPGDGNGAPLFHLLNGDLCYANLDIFNAPGVWRDFGINCARSAANRPWMPALGNHETEFGTCDHAGQPGTAPGGIAAQAAAGNYWNGPYGYGHYLSRFLLPDNDVTNWDGNHLRGNFYSFQVGTVKFISLDADDVIYQDGASAYLNATPNAAERDNLIRRLDPQRHRHLQPRLHREPQGRCRELLPGAGLQQRNAEPPVHLARARAARGPPGSVGRHDRGLHAPVRDVNLAPRQRLRPGHPPGLAAAVRPVRGRPGAVRARA